MQSSFLLSSWRNKVLALLMAACAVLFAFAIALSAPLAANATPGVDDYPDELKEADKDSIIDPWRFYNRECVSFVAWRLNNDNGIPFDNFYLSEGDNLVQWSDGGNWGIVAAEHGILVDEYPAPGSVAWTNVRGLGHVAWVHSVDGDMVTLEEYNYDNDGHYRMITVDKSSYVGYIHFKDLAQAIPTASSDSVYEGFFYIVPKIDATSCITVGDDSLTQPDALIAQNVDGLNQQMQLVAQDDGSFAIKLAESELALTVLGEGAGADVQMREWSNADTQHWFLIECNDGYFRLIPKSSGYSLDVADAEGQPNLQQWTNNASDAQLFSLVPVDTKWVRLAGDDRLQTNAAILDQAFADGSVTRCLLTTAWNYPDALTASSLAGLWGCPIVTTDSTMLTASTSAELQRLASKSGMTVYVLGGTEAISDEVVQQVGQLEGISVFPNRLAGSDRFATAQAVYSAATGGQIVTMGITTMKVGADGQSSWPSTCIVASGNTFADALSISSYAYTSKAPIFLANEGTLPDDAVKTIAKGGFDRVILVGGDAACDSAAVRKQLEEAGVEATYVQLAGEDRYQTSMAVATWANGATPDTEFAPSDKDCLSYDGMAVSTGQNYADALSSVNLLGKTGSTLLLIDDSDEGWAPLGLVEQQATSIGRAHIVGGPEAVSYDMENQLAIATSQPTEE